MALTNSLLTVATALETKLALNKSLLLIEDVYYGDQDKITKTPVVCIEPDGKLNQLHAAQRKLQRTFRIWLLVYHAAIDSPQANRKEVEARAEAIETLIHQDRTLSSGASPEDGLLIHCYIETLESGYTRKPNSVLRSSRLLFTGISQDILPS